MANSIFSAGKSGIMLCRQEACIFEAREISARFLFADPKKKVLCLLLLVTETKKFFNKAWWKAGFILGSGIPHLKIAAAAFLEEPLMAASSLMIFF